MNIGNWKVTRSDIGGHAEAGLPRGRGQKGPPASLGSAIYIEGIHVVKLQFVFPPVNLSLEGGSQPRT